MKIVIIGNAGSGKTWLSNKLNTTHHWPITHLDDLFWEPSGFNKKRSQSTITQMTQTALQNDSWISEGVFGDLARDFITQCSLLLWLDLDWRLCESRLHKRFALNKGNENRSETAESFQALLKWATEYYERTGLRSHQGHQHIFSSFSGEKLRIQTANQVNEIISEICNSK